MVEPAIQAVNSKHLLHMTFSPHTLWSSHHETIEPFSLPRSQLPCGRTSTRSASEPIHDLRVLRIPPPSTPRGGGRITFLGGVIEDAIPLGRLPLSGPRYSLNSVETMLDVPTGTPAHVSSRTSLPTNDARDDRSYRFMLCTTAPSDRVNLPK